MTDIQLTIDVLYSCALCGLHKIPVAVPVRESEDVVDWVQKVAVPRLVADHQRRSPPCHPKSFSDVMIPLGGDRKIGGATKN